MGLKCILCVLHKDICMKLLSSFMCPTQMRARKHQLPVKEELLERLEKSIQTIISSLPEDLQTVLHRQWQPDPREHWPADPLRHTQMSVQNIPAVYEPLTPAQVSTNISSGKPIHYHYEAFHFGCTVLKRNSRYYNTRF